MQRSFLACPCSRRQALVGMTGPLPCRKGGTICGDTYAEAGMIMRLWVWVSVGGGMKYWVGCSVAKALSKFTLLVRMFTSQVMIQMGSKLMVAGRSASIRSSTHAGTEL